MKIGILTFHHSLNCGAVLQAYATQSFLRKQGYDAEVVNYGKIGWPERFPVHFGSVRQTIGSILRNARTLVIEDRRRKLYREFLDRQMRLGPSIGRDEIVRTGYTHLIVGSDQVWHPIINEGDSVYYLAEFPATVRRIAYAPSFGVAKLDGAEEVRVSRWLRQFDALSAREPKAADYVKSLTGREVQVVCDPTLLLAADDFTEIERQPSGLPDRYVAVYTVCGHPWAESAALAIGRKRGLPVVHLVGGRFACWYLPGQSRRISALGPSEFLWFVRHADFVVTNSFHGTVFSLQFHRPLWVALNDKPSDERMVNLLSEAGVGGRASVRAKDVTDACDADWNAVDARIAQLRTAGSDYLKGALV